MINAQNHILQRYIFISQQLAILSHNILKHICIQISKQIFLP